MQKAGHVELLGSFDDPPIDLVRVESRLGRGLRHELAELDPGDLDGVLKALHQAESGPLVDIEVEQLGARQRRISHDLVAVASAEDVAQGRFAGAIGTHQGMDLTEGKVELDPLEDLAPSRRSGEFLDR